MVGNIPKNITIFSRPPQTLTDEQRKHYKYSTVFPSYVSDATNKATLKTGESWVKYYKTYADVKSVSRENKPTAGYRILDLDVRSEGGRAYKVVSPYGEYVDLREDVLLDTIREVGISPGGVLNGEFIFATVGSQMKLVRVGSDLHKSLVEATANRGQKIKKSELEPSCIYRNVKDEKFAFIGYVDCVKAHYNTERNNFYPFAYSNIITEFEKLTKAQLWISVYDWKSMLEKPSKYQYEVLKEKKVVEKVGEKYPFDNLEEIIEWAKSLCLDNTEAGLLFNCELLTMAPAGTPLDLSYQLRQLILPYSTKGFTCPR